MPMRARRNIELALRMWAAGEPPWPICEASGYGEPSHLYHAIWRARQAGDPRALKRTGNRNGTPPTKRLKVIHLKRAGLRNIEIAQRIGSSAKSVDVMVCTARARGELPAWSKAA